MGNKGLQTLIILNKNRATCSTPAITEVVADREKLPGRKDGKLWLM